MGCQRVVGIEVRIDGRVHRSLLDERGTHRLRSSRRITIVASVAVAIAFVLLAVYVTTYIPDADRLLDHVVLTESVALCLLMVFLGLWTGIQNLRTRPFVLTPQGFTLPRVPVGDALAGRDTFVALGRLSRVLVDKPRFRGSPYPRLRFEYVDGRGQQRVAYLDGSDIEDPLEVMWHLKRLAPDALGENVAQFVHEDLAQREHLGEPHPFAGRRSDTTMEGLIFIVMIPMMALPMVGLLTEFALLPTTSIYTAVILAMFYLGYRGVKSTLRKMTLSSSIATTTGITMPRTLFTSIFVKPRPEVPFKDIKQVRDGLDADGWDDRAHVEMWIGETFYVSRQVMLQMKPSPWFEFDGLTITNRNRPADGGARLFSPNHVLLVPYIVGLLLIPWLGAGLFSLMGFRVFLVILPMMMVLPFGMMVLIFVTFYRRHRGKDMTASPAGIRVPKARRRFREVPSSEITEIRTAPGFFEPHLLVVTRRGKLRIPLDMAEELLRNGYPIVDKYGYVGGSILNLLESPRGPDAIADGPDTTEARGEFIAIEPEKALRMRKNELLRGSALFLAISLFIPAMFYSMTLVDGEGMDLGDWAFVLAVSSMFYVPTAIFLYGQWRMRPQRMYERGIEVQGFWGKMRFTPWEKFTAAHEEEYKGVRKLVLDGKGVRVSVDGSVERYEHVLELVTQALGAKAVKTLGAGRGSSAEAPGASKVAGPGATRKSPPRMSRDEVPDRYGAIRARMGLWMGTMVTVMSVAMLLLMTTFPEASPALGPPQLSTGNTPLLGMNGTHVAEDLRLERGVVVRDGEALSIVDSRLTIAPFANGTAAIHVEPGGRLELVNTTIVAVLDGRGFSVEIEGSALIDGCNLTYEPVLGRFQTGLRTIRVRSDDVTIQNSSFWGDLQVGVAVVGCSPVIRGCTFGNVSRAGVALFDGTATVSDSTFVRCRIGVLCHSGNLTVDGCVFVWNRVGVQIWDANASVVSTLFEGNTWAIEYLDPNRPAVINTTFSDNFDDYDEIGDASFFMMNIIIMQMLPIITIQVVVMSVWKARRWWEPDLSRVDAQGTAH